MNKLVTHRTAPFFLLGLVLVMFADVLVAPLLGHQTILSARDEDLATQFLYWYDFGFRELRHGHLALWNPYVFSGTPWLGNFESALLYPINWLFCVLPIAAACNWVIATHVFLTGWFTFLWLRHHRLHPLACFTSAALVMFGAPYFLRIYAGHLTNMAALAWAPLLLLCADELLDGPGDDKPRSARRHFVGWCLAGVYAVAMQVLAGHPQSVFRTGVAVGLYVALRLWHSPQRWRALAGLMVIYAGAAALCAMQLGAGLDMAAESTRAAGVPYSFAAMFSLPPENLVTALAPKFFGNMRDMLYWGRLLFWEATFFIGLSGLALACYGVLGGQGRRRWIWALMPLLLLALALGGYTPLFGFLFAHVPGFSKFRVNAEYIFPASMFVAALAGNGLHTLMSAPRRTRAMSFSLLAMAVLLGGAAWFIRSSAALGEVGAWGHFLTGVISHREAVGFAPDATYRSPDFLQSAAAYASFSLFTGVLFCLVLAYLFLRRARTRRAAYLLAALAIGEIFWFARANRPIFNAAAVRQPEIKEFLAAHPGDYRVLNLASLNSGMSLGAKDIWGYDPILLARYAQFMAWTQGEDPDQALGFVNLQRDNPLYRMLRDRYVFIADRQNPGQTRIADAGRTLPHLLLLHEYSVLPGRDAIFAAMAAPGFDARHRVLLETEPTPKPLPRSTRASTSTPDRVKVVELGTDFLVIEAHTAQPAILLVTDSYSRYWRAYPVSDAGGQREYSVLPANYVLRAIPLQAGDHRLVMEYAPPGFLRGRWISLLACALYLGALVWWWRSRRFANGGDSPVARPNLDESK
jgi:hypothetical protein